MDTPRALSVAAALAAVLAVGNLLSTPAYADARGWSEAAGPPEPPSRHASAVVCLMSLDELYDSGLSAAELRDYAIAQGLSAEAIQYYLDYIGDRPPVLHGSERPEGYEPDPALKEEALRALGEVVSRFSGSNLKQRTVGVMLMQIKPEFWEPTINLARNMREFLPEGDLSASPTPTGDALFDRYALAVDARIDEYLQRIAGGEKLAGSPATMVPALKDETLAQWEAEFGSDPRYWELRFFCASARQRELKEQSLGLAAAYDDPLDFLDEAEKRGIARPATLLARFCYPFNMRQREVNNRNLARDFAAIAKGEKVGEGEAVPKEHAPEELAALEAALQAWPDVAWLHYVKGRLHQEAGEEQLAVAELKLGNSCPDKQYPYIFPQEFIFTARLKQPPGGPVTCGAISSAGGYTYWADPRELHKAVGHLATATYDLSLLQPTADFILGQIDQPASPLRALDMSAMLSAGINVETKWHADSLSNDELLMLGRQRALLELTRQSSYARYGWENDQTTWATLLTGTALLRGTFAGAYLTDAMWAEFDRKERQMLLIALTPGYLLSNQSPKLMAFEPLSAWEARGRRWGRSTYSDIDVRAGEVIGVEDPNKKLAELFGF